MTRSGVLVSVAICGVVAGCGGSPSAPSGVPVFAEGKISMTFTPQNQRFANATEEYRRVWAADGSRIVDAMEQGTGLTFLETHVNAVIFDGVSSSGGGSTPMYLRASHPADLKKAVLVHEYGHRLIAQLRIRPADLPEHHVLDLFLYDVWESLWGRDLADREVRFERELGAQYEAAWTWALSLTRAERVSRFADIVRANRQ